MTRRDYLWCVLNLILDDEEAAARLCPECRARAEENRCPVCGALTADCGSGENTAFDAARYEKLRKGGAE